MKYQKKDCFDRIAEKMRKHRLIVAAGVDSLEQEKCCDKAGCDLILLYPTAKYEHASNRFLAGFLAFGNVNEMMEQMATDLMPMMNNRNLMAGLNGSDPFKNDRILLQKMKEFGFMGIHNYPTMSLVDGTFGMNIEYLKSGLDKEIQLLKKASEMGFHTCGMVSTQKQALQLVRADIDMIIFYLGLGENPEHRGVSNKERTEQDIRKLKELTAGIRNISKTIPILFFDEQLNTVNEIKTIIQEVKEINGYFLMPVTQKPFSHRQLQLEIEQLLEICY